VQSSFRRQAVPLTAKEIENIIREGVPMAEDIDFRVDEVSAERAVARVPFSSRLVRPGGTLSGPTMMGLADAAMYAVILAARGRVEMAVTSNLNINFILKPHPGDLVAEAILLKLGKRLAFCEVRLTSEGSPDLVAHVTGSYSIPPQTE